MIDRIKLLLNRSAIGDVIVGVPWLVGWGVYFCRQSHRISNPALGISILARFYGSFVFDHSICHDYGWFGRSIAIGRQSLSIQTGAEQLFSRSVFCGFGGKFCRLRAL